MNGWLAVNVPTQPHDFDGLAGMALWVFLIFILVVAIRSR